MVKKCIYCSKELSQEEVIDVCQPCGFQVWGEKMYEAIRDNMKQANSDGDLYQGSVTDKPTESKVEPNPQFSQPSNSQPSEPVNSEPIPTSNDSAEIEIIHDSDKF